MIFLYRKYVCVYVYIANAIIKRNGDKFIHYLAVESC